MKKLNLIFVALLISVAVIGQAHADSDYAPGQLIIKLKEGKAPDENFLQNHRLKSPRKVSKKNAAYVAEIDGAADPLELARNLKKDPQVEFAEPNYIVRGSFTPNDSFFFQLWGLQTIDAPEAWDANHDTNMIIGVIDSGINYNHPDLVGNIWTNPNEIAGNSIDDDNNGFIDDNRGWDFANNDNDPFDDNGHGSHVAGIIGAQGNNGIGVAGVNWNAQLVPIKFLGADNTGTIENAVRAIEYANSLGIKINNASWRTIGFSQLLRDAIAEGNNGGHLFIAAAGNSNADTDATPFYPAAFDLPNVISVAASNQQNGLTSISNYGANSVDITAPGEGIVSTYLTNSYATLSGTSMATAYVTGAAALLWSANPGLTHLQIKNKILDYSELSDSLIPLTLSGGILNIFNFFDADVAPPAAITNLSVIGVTRDTATLSWTASGDDGNTGTASRYDIRYSTQPITSVNFDQATQIIRESKPKISGASEIFTAKGLLPDTTYYFALRVLDNVNNNSGISNIVFGKTLIPSIVFFDNMENSGGNWTVEGDLWHQSNRRYVSANTSWYYGREATGNYDNGRANQGKLVSGLISLANLINSELTFKHFLATENFHLFDNAKVEVSNNGGASWNTLLTRLTTNGNWVNESISLSAYDGQTIKIRFYFNTVDDSFNFFEGWYVDDVMVKGTPTIVPPTANAGGPYIGQESKPITFDGSGSSDSSNLPLTYRWDFGDGSSTVAMANATTTHAYANPGIYTVSLVVNNGNFDSQPSTAQVTITDIITVTRAIYKENGSNNLKVRAISSRNGEVELIAQGFGVMTYHSTDNFYQLFTEADSYPPTITITSSLGRSVIAPVELK